MIRVFESGEAVLKIEDMLKDPITGTIPWQADMFAVAFDLTVAKVRKHYPQGVSRAYAEIGREGPKGWTVWGFDGGNARKRAPGKASHAAKSP